MLFKFLLLFPFIIYSSEKEQKHYFTNSLKSIENNFFNESSYDPSCNFQCRLNPILGQKMGLCALYGANGEEGHRHGFIENLSSSDSLRKWVENFEDIKTGHFYYVISAILLHFLPTLYFVKVKEHCYDDDDIQKNTNRIKINKYNKDFWGNCSYSLSSASMQRTREEFDYPVVIKKYDDCVEGFFDEIDNYVKNESESEVDPNIKKLHKNKDLIKQYHKNFEFLFDKKKREEEKDKSWQQRIHTYIDEDNKKLIDSLKKYTNKNANGKEELLSKKEFEEMTEILWDTFEKFPH